MIAYPRTVSRTDPFQIQEATMSVENLSYTVPGMSCEHCRSAISKEVGAVSGVESVDVDLSAKIVTVHGVGISDVAVREAIDEAGYDIAEAAV
jgi:copper chaperone